MSVPISQRELRNGSAQIMDRVEAGESFTVTRNHVPVAQLRPIDASLDELATVPLRNTKRIAAVLRKLPRLDYQVMRQEADDFFQDGGDQV
ncbi:MAG: type II toxin-antitoxin system prevent-host-death family antitoxin [Propionibacteriaceae bacterium]|jgi:prevent-host-death family protein|nr:type II toxin-antitoxin system prevent-host-death family antitoxin [Propionibacteriaceae bacterium]